VQPSLDQRGLQLAQKCRVIRELACELALEAAAARESLRGCLGLVGEGVERAHRLAGGSSPVATRQIEEAARRAPIAAAALIPA
jgi:hypothetical protein